MYENVATLRNTIQAMRPFGPHTVLLVVANPVDLLTSLAQQLSGLPASQVLGSGTFLDSVRLRGMVAARTKVCRKSTTGTLSHEAAAAAANLRTPPTDLSELH